MNEHLCCGDCPCCDAYSACWTARGVVHKQEVARLEAILARVRTWAINGTYDQHQAAALIRVIEEL